jgi:hypothetical protein
MKNLIILSFVIALVSCDFYDDRLSIYNKTDKSIFVSISVDSFSSNSFYDSESIYSGEKKVLPIRGKNKWSTYVVRNTVDKLYFFIYDLDTLNKYNNFEYLNDQKLYIKKIELTGEQIYQRNWTIEIQ